PSQILLNLTIITESKKAEDALKESKERLTALIENTPDIICSVDKQLYITTFNSSFKILIKLVYNRDVNVGDKLEDILPEGSEGWMLYYKRALNGERLTFENNAMVGKKNTFYEVSFNPIFSDEGGINGVSMFSRDITQRKISEEAIIR